MATLRRVSSADLADVLLGLARGPSSTGGARIHKKEVDGLLRPFGEDGVVTRGELARLERHLPVLADPAQSTRGARDAVGAFRAEHGAGQPGKMPQLRRSEAFDQLASHLRYVGAWQHGRALTVPETQALLRLLGEDPAPARVAQVRELRVQLGRAGHSTSETRAVIDAWLEAHPIAPPPEALGAQLDPLLAGLRWPSESDREVYAVHLGNARKPLSEARLLDRLGESASTAVERADFVEVFDRLTHVDDPGDAGAVARAARFGELRAVLEASLTDLVVYRVGTIDIDVYVLGRTAKGELVGVGSSVVET